MFNMFKSKVADAANRFAGRTDVLEAMCAHIALVSAADGSVEDDEIATGLQVAKDNPTLSNNFSASEIETCLDKQLRRTKGFSGKAGLVKEIEDCAKHDDETREAIWLIGADVAEACGGIGDKEKVVLRDTAKRLGVNPAKFGL